ncbi:MAG: hypothetical protein IT444_11525 [Phycisphaeraceae bacterium]|nr:hypothetical protein [Phycisphaeraceae bacterium]
MTRTHTKAGFNASQGVVRTEDIQRHQAMVKLVFEWMARTHASQQLLVRCIEEFWQRRGQADYRCDHSLLSRVLNPVDPHVPTPNRPRSMQILQAAMVVCARTSDPNVVNEATDDDAVWSSDDEQAFKIHRVRLRQLRENSRGSLFESLHRIGEFFAVARGLDDSRPSNTNGETLRCRASENVLLALAAVVDPGAEWTPLIDRLRHEGVADEEADRLVREQIARVEAILAAVQPSVNMNAYAGVVLFHSGQRQQGMERLMQAVAASHDFHLRHDPHWRTMFDLLERLLAAEDAEAVNWSRSVAAIAQTSMAREGGYAQLLREAWREVEVPLLRRTWREQAAALVNALDDAAAGPRATVPATPSRRVKAKVVLPIIAVLLALLGVGQMFATESLAIFAVGNEAAISTAAPLADRLAGIHGREASRPTDPPPPTDPPQA